MDKFGDNTKANTNKYDVLKAIIDGIFNLKAIQFAGLIFLVVAITNFVIVAKTPSENLSERYMADIEKIMEIFLKNDNILIAILVFIIIILTGFLFGLISYNNMLRKQINKQYGGIREANKLAS